MSSAETVTVYLDSGLRDRAAAGQHNFISKIENVLTASGFNVSYRLHGDAVDGLSLSHMKPATGPRGLVFRRAYHYPFWQIDPSHERWNWQVANAAFDVAAVPPTAARRFYRFWQSRLFGDGPERASRDGFIYVPLQGRLFQHRSFQTCSPLWMLQQTLTHAPGRKVVATLHPGGDYSESEKAAVHALAKSHTNLQVQLGGMEQCLRTCDSVVTQNSSAAFNGYFFGKPAILFGRVDFHHIALNVDTIGEAACFMQASRHAPDYAAYLWWFWQEKCINAGRPEAQDKIALRLRQLGWPV